MEVRKTVVTIGARKSDDSLVDCERAMRYDARSCCRAEGIASMTILRPVPPAGTPRALVATMPRSVAPPVGF